MSVEDEEEVERVSLFYTQHDPSSLASRWRDEKVTH